MLVRDRGDDGVGLDRLCSFATTAMMASGSMGCATRSKWHRLVAFSFALGVARCGATTSAPAEPPSPAEPPPDAPADPVRALADPSSSDASEPHPALLPEASVVAPADASDVASPNAADAASPMADAAAPSRPKPTKRKQCQSEAWGGWGGTAECRAKAARRIPAKHKPCDQDSDCVVVGPACYSHAVAAKFESAYEDFYPCGNPRAGQCAQRFRPACVEGCCDLVGKW